MKEVDEQKLTIKNARWDIFFMILFFGNFLGTKVILIITLNDKWKNQKK